MTQPLRMSTPEGPGQPGYPPPGQPGYPPPPGGPPPPSHPPPAGAPLPGQPNPGWVPPMGPQAYYPPGDPKWARPEKGNRRKLVVLGIVGLLIVAGVVSVAVLRDRLTGEAASLQVGDCIDLPTGDTDFVEVQHQPCNEPHDAEVFMVLVHPARDGDLYPGDARFEIHVNENCMSAFEAYVGGSILKAELTVGWFQPTRTGWASGDRGMTCHIARIDQAKLTSSVRAAPQGT